MSSFGSALRRALAALGVGSVGFMSATSGTPPIPERVQQHGVEAPSFATWFIGSLPQRALSRAYGSLARVELPECVRAPVYRLWGAVFNSNLDEIEYPLSSYLSLSEFFCRPLKTAARPIADADIVSPVDGLVTVCGPVPPNNRVDQVKGMSYSVNSFLGFEPDVDTSPGSGRRLYYCVLYLAPGDYHRIHSPTNWDILERIHYPGDMYPVNPLLLKVVPGLFTLNERIVLSGKWAGGFHSLSAVAALNVGSMLLSFDQDVVCNAPQHDHHGHACANPYGVGRGSFVADYDEGELRVHAGQELARFQLGSTVVLVFESDADEFSFAVQPGDKVRMGERLGCVGAAPR